MVRNKVRGEGKGNGSSLNIVPKAAYHMQYASQTEPPFNVGHSPSPHTWTLVFSHMWT